MEKHHLHKYEKEKKYYEIFDYFIIKKLMQ